MLYVPHFGYNTPINNYVKQLLVFFHDGVLRMGTPIPVDIELIAIIRGLPFTRKNPTPLLKKDQEATIVA